MICRRDGFRIAPSKWMNLFASLLSRPNPQHWPSCGYLDWRPRLRRAFPVSPSSLPCPSVRRRLDSHRFNVPADQKGKGSNLLYRWQSQCQVNEIHRRVRLAVYLFYSIWALREVVGNRTRTYTYIFGGVKCKTINKMTQVVH